MQACLLLSTIQLSPPKKNVLHPLARSDLKSRRDRCDCAPTEEDAKRCFILPFDRCASRLLLLRAAREPV